MMSLLKEAIFYFGHRMSLEGLTHYDFFHAVKINQHLRPDIILEAEDTNYSVCSYWSPEGAVAVQTCGQESQ